MFDVSVLIGNAEAMSDIDIIEAIDGIGDMHHELSKAVSVLLDEIKLRHCSEECEGDIEI